MKSRIGLAIVPLVDILLVLLALMMLLVAVPQDKEVSARGSLPRLTGEAPPQGLEVRMDGKGALQGAAAKWALPAPGQDATLYCQEAKVWREPVIRLRAEGATPLQPIMALVSFLQACEVGEVAVIGASGSSPSVPALKLGK